MERQERRQDATRVRIGRLGARIGDQVRVCGWVQTLRLQRRMQFVVLRDETGAVQLTTGARSGRGSTGRSMPSLSGRRSR